MKLQPSVAYAIAMTVVVSWTIPTDLRASWQLILAFGVTFAAGLAARRRRRVIARAVIIGILAGLAHLALVHFSATSLPPPDMNDVVVYRVVSWPSAIVATVTAMVLALLVDLVVGALSRRRLGAG